MEEPIETIRRYNGACPRCGKKLSYDLEKIRIASATPEAIKQYFASPVSPFVTIQTVVQRPTSSISTAALGPTKTHVPLAIWLRKRNSSTQNLADHDEGPEVSSPTKSSP